MTKTFDVTKQEVWRAYGQVRTNRGAAGSDGVTIEKFEENLKDNLYKLWNRLSSGSYFPSPVRRVEIPKGNGQSRPLGIPTVVDRIAQAVIKNRLEPVVEQHFHEDSYGYRPGKSAKDAVSRARQRCWESDWVLDMDIQSFFDTLDHDLVMVAVSRFTECHHTKLYISRWLKGSVIMKDGQQVASERGVPQGGVISPLIANIYLHLTFDKWMQEKHPDIKFERYADDIVVHCKSLKQLEWIKSEIEERLSRCKLQLSETKTKSVYCKDDRRRGEFVNHSFDFLGFTFRPRSCQDAKGRLFIGFNPAVSRKAQKSIRTKIKQHPMIKSMYSLEIEDVAKAINPIVQGWINYFKVFRKSALLSVYN